MFKSRLNYQISFCELIDKLNDKGCLQVIRLLQQTMKCNDLNGSLIKILNNLSQQLPMDALPDIYNKIEKMVEDESHRKQPPEKTKTTDNNDVLFPLLELPDDLISKTSFYLNENDIFQFEKCCRLFYQMINNTNYLNQTTNFKTLTITHTKLHQMADSKHCFFKYIKAQQLKFDFDNEYDIYDCDESINAFITQLHNQWEKAKMVMNVDNLYGNIFKSIKSIKLGLDGSILLDKFPINILFDSKISNLEKIEMDHYWNGRDEKYLTKCLKNFESQYLQFKKKLEQHDEKIQKLKLFKVNDANQTQATVIGPKYIVVNHLYFDNITIDYFNYFYQQLKSDSYDDYNYSSIRNIKILTIKCNNGLVEPISSSLSMNSNLVKDDLSKFGIETLRFLTINDINEYCDMNILNDKKIIESLNLQNSLKNLTIHVSASDYDEFAYHPLDQAIETIFNKKYFYKLENVNILFDIHCNQKKNTGTIIQDIFSFFKENRTILKYQFKQLNIGLSQYFSDVKMTTYHTFEWNKGINDQFLDKQCDIGCQTEQVPFDRLAHERKFNQWKNQWV